MAELFAVIGGVFSLIDISLRFAEQTSSLIQQIRDAPEDFLSLANEVTDSLLVLFELERSVRHARLNSNLEGAEVRDLLNGHLQSAAETWQALRTMVNAVQLTLPDGTVRLSRVQWLRREVEGDGAEGSIEGHQS